MPSLAALITQYQLNRRLVVSCVGAACASALFIGAILDASGTLTKKDLLSAAVGLVLAVHFGRAAYRGWPEKVKASR